MRISDWSSDVCSSDLVLHVPEATPGSLDLLDEKVRGLDRAVRGSCAVVVQDLAAPAAQGLEEPGELGPGVGIGAPGDGVIERFGGLREVVGEVHVPDLLLAGPGGRQRVVGVTGGEGGVDPFPAPGVESFGS